MKKSSKKPWPTKVVNNYQPKISILVPTYNESSTILLKMINLSLVKYPLDLMEIIIVDSNSSDGTGKIMQEFCEEHPQTKMKILLEKERKGKSHALNYALDYCNGEVIIVSDADCFWPSDILEKAMPFLADPTVGAICGPKILLNANQNWITRMEARFLKSANSLRLGESKAGSTVFFEGGFSAFKTEAIDGFDPHDTGSDDCGTALNTIENGYRAILIPEAKFYTTFSMTIRNKLSIKLRRANQLIRVFWAFLKLYIGGKLNTTKITLLPNILLYLFSPLAFIVFLALTGFMVYNFPYLLLTLLLLLVPNVRFYFYQILENNLLLVTGVFGVITGKNFSIWSQPEDRALFNKDTLTRFNLI